LPAEGVGELTEAREFFVAAGEARWANIALACLARNALWNGELELARERMTEVLTAARSLGDELAISVALNNLAETDHALGNTESAIRFGREVLERDRSARNTLGLCYALTNMSSYLISIQELDEARDLAREALRKSTELQMLNLIAASIQHLAAIASYRGEHERAALLLGCTNSKFDAIFRESTEQREYDETLAVLRQALGESRLSALLQRGATMPQEQAVNEALKV
jgi:tetratricopeptide (TPR) repeat protein